MKNTPVDLILEATLTQLIRSDRWTNKAEATTKGGVPVEPWAPAAARFSLYGAMVRAKRYGQFSTADLLFACKRVEAVLQRLGLDMRIDAFSLDSGTTHHLTLTVLREAMAPPEPAIVATRVPLTEAQRRSLSVDRDVRIPGANGRFDAAPDMGDARQRAGAIAEMIRNHPDTGDASYAAIVESLALALHNENAFHELKSRIEESRNQIAMLCKALDR